jgi:HEAT repeat protein
MTTPEAVQTLLNSEDFGQRLSGVNQLRSLPPQQAFAMIQGAIADPNTRVRYAAISQLSSLGQQDRSRSQEILRHALLQDPEPDVQAAAADALGALKLTDAFDDLQQVYHRSGEWLVQFSIIAALGELGDVRAFDLLETALASPTELVKTAAIGSLGELGDRRAIPLLLPLISDPDWQVRHRVAQALGLFQSPEVQPALEQLAQDDVAAVAQQAKDYL